MNDNQVVLSSELWYGPLVVHTEIKMESIISFYGPHCVERARKLMKMNVKEQTEPK